MKRMIIGVSIGMLVMFGGLFLETANAQECVGGRVRVLSRRCGNSICQGSLPVVLTTSCGGSDFVNGGCNLFEPTEFQCCGITYMPLVPTGSVCLFAGLRDHEIRHRLLALAKNKNILVPTCNGLYMPVELVIHENL